MVAAAIVIISGALFFSLSAALGNPAGKAAIVDQLNLTYASPEFVQKATDILKRSGYSVDYYPPEQGSVEFYRRLPSLGYKVIVLRVHTPRLQEDNGELGADVALVTSDVYDANKPVSKQEAAFLVKVLALTGWPLREQYGVTDAFIAKRMEGSLNGADIILTGCSGLRSDKLAKAFVSRGARHVVGWDGEVAPAFTDDATVMLLQALYLDKTPLDQAVSDLSTKVGMDPYYGGRLTSYPPASQP